MTAEHAVELAQQTLLSALIICSPALGVAMIVALIVGLLQALTQIQEQTVAFVPKLVATVLALALTAPWLLQRLLTFTTNIWSSLGTPAW